MIDDDDDAVLDHVVLRLFRLHMDVHCTLGHIERRGRPLGGRDYVSDVSIGRHISLSGRLPKRIETCSNNDRLSLPYV